ncbi:alpha/beta hydrolase fold domain-containing protein [uncultured Methanobrevibacter sp.]|uniref:alpha/beta hydrolase fold domain-containing protein n=1 Tax=uncultured Methanobrevibacter sp. TaxID=253161 RepID=UPI0025EA7383|nr:alpha/beta hydrolase fold domain-containing protein [uncultured Methanobrevibacter sp.]
MSKRSKIIETVLEKTHREYIDDADKAKEHLTERSLEEDEPYEIPKRIYHTKVESKDMFGCQMVLFNEIEDAERLVIYIHGGIYVNEIRLPHISFCDNLAKKINACVFTPIYPLAPNHTYKETYEIVEKLYNHLLTMNKPIIIMGDSAGGGFTASFCEYLDVNNLPQPKNIILISPWVDVSMSGDYDDVEYDPMLGVEGAREMGKAWAGDLDPKDYRISPLFGEVSKLPKTTLFIGTHEIIYSDVIKFYDKLKDNGVDVELNVGEEMSHVYPLYPFVPESKEAFNHIVEILLE